MSSWDQQQSAERLGYVRGLDGLRAIAVAAVVVFHATDTLLRGGFLGVDVFFVLSGFLITSQLLAEWQRRRQIGLIAFWRRRGRRILAALYLLLAVTLSFALVAHPEEVAVFRGDALAAFAYVSNWYFIFHNQPYFEVVAHPSPLIHLWSLGVEEQFYLLWPLILTGALPLLRRWTPLLVLAGAAASCALMAVLYQPGADPSRLYYGTDTHASGLLLGSFLAFVWRPGARQAQPGAVGSTWAHLRAALGHSFPIDSLALATLAALGFFFAWANDSQSFLYLGGFTVVAGVTALCVVAVSHPRALMLTAVLELAPIRWLGRRSYSVYLWHWPVVVFTRPGVDVIINGLPLFLLRVGLALALAELSFRYVEEPVRRGALARLWRRLQEAQRTRQWGRVLTTGIGGVAIAGFLLGICMAAAQAKVPAPPPYLAETSVNTIARTVQAATQPATATAAATPPPPPTSPPTSQPAAPATPVLRNPTAAASLSSAADVPAPAAALSGSPISGVTIPDSPATPVAAGSVIAIGDSVMLGAVPALAAAIDGIQVDATVSRQVSNGIGLLQQLRAEGVLSDVVIVGLGSNGTFTRGQFDQIMGVLSGTPRVVFINVRVPRSWEESNDAVIADGVQHYQTARLVDWYGASINHPEFFQSDQYHLRPEGAAAYAAMVAQVVTGP